MKNIFFLLLTSLYFTNTVHAQTKMSRTDFDLGDIGLLNADIVDFSIKNITQGDLYILRIDAEQEVGIQYTSKTVRQGEEENLRIKLNPTKRGKMSRKIKLFLSTEPEPVELTISANVKAIPKNNRQACPQFGSALKPPSGKVQAVAKIKEFPVTFYDETSGEQLAEAMETEQEVKTIEPVTQNQRSTPRPSRTRTTRIKKTPEERRNSPSLGQILFGNTQDTVKEVNEPVIEEKVIAVEETILPEEKETVVVEQKKVVDPNLLDDNFKPNNIVFLIDASTSMREEGKMDILKQAMIQLLEPLREQDYLSIVTYSGEAKVVMEPTQGNKKEEIKTSIENILADGSTQAVKGIKKAITVGKSSFIEEGNNQIILATDGAFDIGEYNKSLRRKIENTANEGLTLTILGIKNANWTNKSLKELVELGKGDLIKIKNETDASKVLEEVKSKSLY